MVHPAGVRLLREGGGVGGPKGFRGVQEEFYLEENVEKAIAIDEWSPDALTTSMVDDVFFILQKCGGRALAIGSLQCLCAILGQLNNLLRDSLRSALEYKWKAGSQPVPQTWNLRCVGCQAQQEWPVMPVAQRSTTCRNYMSHRIVLAMPVHPASSISSVPPIGLPN